MGNSVEPLPEGLWSSIASHLPERHDEEPPAMPRLVAGEPTGPGAPIVPMERRRARGTIAAVGAFAVAAAAVAALLGIGLVHANTQVANDQALARSRADGAVVAALETPGHQVVNLKSTDHATLAQFVIASGRGYMVSSSLRAGQTYQLWGIIGDQPISLGLLGTSPQQSAFTMVTSTSTSTAPSRLSLTVEPAGGSVVPSGPVVASGVV
jgi:anti-sigma-K factor RskA